MPDIGSFSVSRTRVLPLFPVALTGWINESAMQIVYLTCRLKFHPRTAKLDDVRSTVLTITQTSVWIDAPRSFEASPGGGGAEPELPGTSVVGVGLFGVESLVGL